MCKHSVSTQIHKTEDFAKSLDPSADPKALVLWLQGKTFCDLGGSNLQELRFNVMSSTQLTTEIILTIT